MKSWTVDRIASRAGATLISGSPSEGPLRVVADSRLAGPGDLFIGLSGAKVDGGKFAAEVLGRGAWGVLVGESAASELAESYPSNQAVLTASDPLLALDRLAAAWRLELDAQVVAITGSTGKTTTKDLTTAVLKSAGLSVASSPLNYNTEVGMPLAILAAPVTTEVLVLELAMRGPGQIAQLTKTAAPDVGVIVNIGPSHLEQLGSIAAIAAAKAELIEGLAAGKTAIVPAGERLLVPYRQNCPDLRWIDFGSGGDVELIETEAVGGSGVTRLSVDACGERIDLEVPFCQTHLIGNSLAAIAVSVALGVTPAERIEVALSQLRGERVEGFGGFTIVADCYNANPMSVRAAIDDLATYTGGRRVAVLGDMLELGSDELRYHSEVGSYAMDRGVDLVVGVGKRSAATVEAFGGESYLVSDAEEAATLLPELLLTGDTVLVKGSRGIGLELVVDSLKAPSA